MILPADAIAAAGDQWLPSLRRHANGAPEPGVDRAALTKNHPPTGPAVGADKDSLRVDGISHLTFVVRDLDRMAVFLRDGLGATEVYDSAGADFSVSREKFFLLGGVWLAAMEGEPPAQRSYQHVAFARQSPVRAARRHAGTAPCAVCRQALTLPSPGA